MTTQTLKAEILDTLAKSSLEMTWIELTAKLSNLGLRNINGGTVARSLRKLYQEGLVHRRPKDSSKQNGSKLWSAAQQQHIKTSNTPVQGKAITMCIPTNKPTLVTATLQTVDYLVSQKKNFSAHDVTSKLREFIKDGLAHVDDTEVGTIFAYGRKVPKIEHTDIREIVPEYFLTGKMTDYEKKYDGDHWVYIYVDPQPVQTTSAPTTQPDYTGDPTL